MKIDDEKVMTRIDEVEELLEEEEKTEDKIFEVVCEVKEAVVDLWKRSGYTNKIIVKGEKEEKLEMIKVENRVYLTDLVELWRADSIFYNYRFENRVISKEEEEVEVMIVDEEHVKKRDVVDYENRVQFFRDLNIILDRFKELIISRLDKMENRAVLMNIKGE